VTFDEAPSERRPFRVLATSNVFEPGFRGGGPIKSLVGIVDTISEATEVYLITKDRDLGSTGPYPGLSGQWIRRGGSRVFYLNTSRLGHWFRLWRQLRAIQFDLLYVNSLLSPHFTVIPVVAARFRFIQVARLLLAPRGELAPGALSLKRRRKSLFLSLWAYFVKGMNPTWHASSVREARQIRALSPGAQVEVSQDQVNLPLEPILATIANEGPIRLVFISRIAPVKNLHSALEALMGLPGPIDFDIYGPVEDNDYWARCRLIMSRLPQGIRVTYKGELAPLAVRWTFAGYDAFVFPTLGENFGHIVAESLSASCPVICPDTTPWTEVLAGGGGIVVRDPSVSGLASEIELFAALSPRDRLLARELAGRAYRSWREGAFGPNILEQARVSAWTASP